MSEPGGRPDWVRSVEERPSSGTGGMRGSTAWLLVCLLALGALAVLLPVWDAGPAALAGLAAFTGLCLATALRPSVGDGGGGGGGTVRESLALRVAAHARFHRPGCPRAGEPRYLDCDCRGLVRGPDPLRGARGPDGWDPPPS